MSSASTASCQNAYNTPNGLQASTTGNIYGVYDMSGGSYEYLAAYINNGDSNLTTHGNSIITADAKYKDVYTPDSPDNTDNNYSNSVNKKGDALYETTSANNNMNWYSDYTYMASSTCPWLVRGDFYSATSYAGIFNIVSGDGTSAGDHYLYGVYGGGSSFRPVLLVGAGL